MLKTRLFYMLLLFGVLLVMPTITSNAQDSSEEIVIRSVDAEQYPTVRVFVSSTDSSVDLEGVDGSTINVLLDDEPAKVVSFEQVLTDDIPLSVVLVIDTSDSMATDGLPSSLERMKEAVNLFIDSLAPEDEVAIVSFGSTVSVQYFTQDRDILREQINALQSSGRTALYDASFAGAQIAGTSTYNQRLIVLLTDGQEYGGLSQNLPQAAYEIANQNNAVFYTIGLGVVDEGYLQQLASQTGGQFILQPNSTDLSNLYGSLIDFLSNQYALTFSIPAQSNGTYDMNIEFESLNTTINAPLEIPERFFTVSEEPADWIPRAAVFDGYEMVLVPTGCFMMGLQEGELDEMPVSQQCFEEPFWIDRYEVTNGQFGDSGRVSGVERPRDSVTWQAAQSFCEARGGRLPTEAEWEYAARGPQNTIYPWGNVFDEAIVDLSLDAQAPSTLDLASASWVGAQAMTSNLWEWTSTLYFPYPYDATDGREDIGSVDALRVLRGGAFTNSIRELRTTNRYSRVSNTAFGLIGFRCVVDFGQGR